MIKIRNHWFSIYLIFTAVCVNDVVYEPVVKKLLLTEQRRYQYRGPIKAKERSAAQNASNGDLES